MTRRWWAIGLLVGLLAGFQMVGPSQAAAQLTSAPLEVACGTGDRAPDLVPEVRLAAATATAMQLNRELVQLLPEEFQRDRRSIRRSVMVMLRTAPIDRSQLVALSEDLAAFIDRTEAIARGPNPECRRAVIGWTPGINQSTLVLPLDRRSDINQDPFVSDFRWGPLPDAYVLQAFVQAWLQAEHLQEPAGDFPTEALYKQVGEIAQRAYEAETYSLAVARAMVPVTIGILQYGHGSQRDFPEGLLSDLVNFEAWRRVACGGEATFESLNVTFDGSFQRSGFGRFQHPFRLAAGFAWDRAQFLEPFEHMPELTLEERRALARDGCTRELRNYAAFLFVPPVQLDDTDPSDRAELIDLVENPDNSDIMKWLASNRLAWILWDSDRPTADLQAQAVGADSIHLRWAASQGLAMRWAERVLDGEIGIDTTLSIQGPEGETVASGTLTQLAYQTTESDPALARAPIDALALLHLKNADVLAF